MQHTHPNTTVTPDAHSERPTHQEDTLSFQVTHPAPPPKLEERIWQRIIERIEEGRCTPVIGSGACNAPPVDCDPVSWQNSVTYPDKQVMAYQWALEYCYPLAGDPKLERVAQYLVFADRNPDMMVPKEKFAREFTEARSPGPLNLINEPHRVLAKLPFPVYLTSNFDNWMENALRAAHRNPKLALCRWNKHIEIGIPEFDGSFDYDVANPLLYHFHGRNPWASSAVVSEDDYFEFLLNLARDGSLIAHRVDRCFGHGNTLLFLGYTLSDWDFLVLFRLFASKLRDSGTTHIAVQLEPGFEAGGDPRKFAKAVEYLNSYFSHVKITVYWGSCQEFCNELNQRWDRKSNSKTPPVELRHA